MLQPVFKLYALKMVIEGTAETSATNNFGPLPYSLARQNSNMHYYCYCYILHVLLQSHTLHLTSEVCVHCVSICVYVLIVYQS